ncbi:MAG TPA: patatin-like phospholipase family protein [bacterium]|nr:patatin-like phospholipase family protein [bacterium]
MKTHRFALVVSGAISLGTYEAGVLAQLYQDFEACNRMTRGRARLVIDAIAGASAGSVTGLILAQALALGKSAQDLRAQLRACWVDGLDILALLDPAADPAAAFFTEASIDSVASRVLPEPPSPEAPVRGENVIALWIALTNLDGVQYEIRLTRCWGAGAVSFYPQSYRDYSPFFICGPSIRFVSVPIENITRTTWGACRQSTWDEARDNAVASAAFPLAFRSQVLERDLELYPEYALKFLSNPRIQQWLKEAGLAPTQLQQPRSFNYVDGGVFNNEPIGRAIDAVSYLSCLDPGRVGDPRTYLVVEPDPSTREMATGQIGTAAVGSHGLSPLRVLSKIEQAYFTDTLYRDFEEAAKTNEQLRALEALVKRWDLNPAEVEELKKSVGLARKDVICLERIPIDIPTPGTPRLAGAVFGHFGGFLDRTFREHDFAVGQSEAREWLASWLPAQFDALGLTQVDRDAVQTYLAAVVPPPQRVPTLQEVIGSRGKDIVRCGLDRAEVLAGRWLPIPRPLVRPLRVLLEPVVKALLPGATSARLNWSGALGAFSQTGLGRSIARIACLGLIVLTAVLAGLTWLSGQIAARFGPGAAIVPGAGLGALIILVTWGAYAALRKPAADG